LNPGILYLHLDRPGCFQMALDRVFTDNPLSRPLLRFYTWQPWTLSLGLHQQADPELLERASSLGVPVVRRDTGGRAVFHAEELTYSLHLPGDHPLAAGGILPLYHEINSALLRGFEHLGIAGTQASEPVNLRQHYRSPESDICFSTPVQSEIVFGGRKLVGSAQRRFQNCILQHGSILLGSAHERIVELLFPPEDQPAALQVVQAKAITLTEIAGTLPPLSDICDALTRGMSEQFELNFEAAEPPATLLATVEELRPEFRL